MTKFSLVDLSVSSLFAVQCASDNNSNLKGALKLFYGLFSIMMRRLAANLRMFFGNFYESGTILIFNFNI